MIRRYNVAVTDKHRHVLVTRGEYKAGEEIALHWEGDRTRYIITGITKPIDGKPGIYYMQVRPV